MAREKASYQFEALNLLWPLKMPLFSKNTMIIFIYNLFWESDSFFELTKSCKAEIFLPEIQICIKNVSKRNHAQKISPMRAPDITCWPITASKTRSNENSKPKFEIYFYELFNTWKTCYCKRLYSKLKKSVLLKLL